MACVSRLTPQSVPAPFGKVSDLPEGSGTVGLQPWRRPRARRCGALFRPAGLSECRARAFGRIGGAPSEYLAGGNSGRRSSANSGGRYQEVQIRQAGGLAFFRGPLSAENVGYDFHYFFLD